MLAYLLPSESSLIPFLGFLLVNELIEGLLALGNGF
jgi:hypothetical protein